MERLINGEADEKNSDEKMLEKVNRVAEAARELSEIMQRKVAPEEVAVESELTLDEVLEAIRLSADKIEAIESGT
jgi:RNA polymerase primary sigma factor